MSNASTFRAIEGSIELEFCNDDGEVIATHQQQYDFLIKSFDKLDIEAYLNVYEWDTNGNCIGEANLI